MALRDRLHVIPVSMHDASGLGYAPLPEQPPVANVPLADQGIDRNFSAYADRTGFGQDPLISAGGSYEAGEFGGPHRKLANALSAIADVARAGPHAGEQYIPIRLGKSTFHVYYLPGGGRRVIRVSGPALHVPEAQHLSGAPDRLP